MDEFSFQALGTDWSILVDDEPFTDEVKEKLLHLVSQFEKRFSRFLPDSEANKYRHAKPGDFHISEQFAEMLQTGDALRKLTGGAYDPAVGALLEQSGYDKTYSFIPKEGVENYIVPGWSIQGTVLTLKSSAVFDLGGIGKGYCIDRVADFLKNHDYRYFLVEAGGDMYGTQKADGNAFHIALEWPGKPGTAFGTIELKHQGLAVSDSFRRRWQNWHHIIDPLTKKPIEEVVGCAAIAKSAFHADCMTSGAFLSPRERYYSIAETFKSEFVVFTGEGQILVSENWPGKFLQ